MKKILLWILLVLTPLGAYAGGKKASAKKDAPLISGQSVEVTGTVRLIGNMPFPELALTDADGQDWFIPDEDRPLFAGREGQTLQVQGTVELIDMVLADNTRVGQRRILRRIRVLSAGKSP